MGEQATPHIHEFSLLAGIGFRRMRRAAVDAPSEATRWQAAVHALSRSARLVATVAQVSQSGDAAHALSCCPSTNSCAGLEN